MEAALTREDIRRLIHEGAIRSSNKIGISRARAKILHEKKTRGRRRGHGSREGTRTPRKERWISTIRSIRRRLRVLRGKRQLTKKVYRRLYTMSKGGAFKSVGHMEQHIETRKLARRR